MKFEEIAVQDPGVMKDSRKLLVGPIFTHFVDKKIIVSISEDSCSKNDLKLKIWKSKISNFNIFYF